MSVFVNLSEEKAENMNISYEKLKTLYTVKINSIPFPTLDKCTKETEIELISIEKGLNMVQLIIESNEPDNVFEPEYQEPTYIVYIIINNNVVERLVHPYDFENMEIKEIINILTDIFIQYCK